MDNEHIQNFPLGQNLFQASFSVLGHSLSFHTSELSKNSKRHSGLKLIKGSIHFSIIGVSKWHKVTDSCDPLPP